MKILEDKQKSSRHQLSEARTSGHEDVLSEEHRSAQIGAPEFPGEPSPRQRRKEY